MFNKFAQYLYLFRFERTAATIITKSRREREGGAIMITDTHLVEGYY
jgi:hypothetical protein